MFSGRFRRAVRLLARDANPPAPRWKDAVLVQLPGMLLTRELFKTSNLMGALGLDTSDEDLGEDAVKQGASVADAARGVIDGLDASHGGAPALLVGHSYGGYIAMEVARRWPGRVAGLVLISTQPRGDTAGATRRRQEVVAFGRKAGIDALNRKLLPALMPKARPQDQETLRALQSMAREVGVEGFARQMEACQGRADQRDTLLALPAHIPVLAMGGADDAVIPPRALAEQREILKQREDVLGAGTSPWQVHRLKQCGHLLPMEQPEALHDAAATWTSLVNSHANGLNTCTAAGWPVIS